MRIISEPVEMIAWFTRASIPRNCISADSQTKY